MVREANVEVRTANDLDRMRVELDRLLAVAQLDRAVVADVHVAARELVMFGLTRDGAPSVDVAVTLADGELTLVVEHDSSPARRADRPSTPSMVHDGGRGAPVLGSVVSHQGYVRRGARRGTALVFAAAAHAGLVAS